MTTTTTIKNAIAHINADKYEYQAERNSASFIADVSQYLDDEHNINVADSTHAHNVLCDEMDKYFA